MEPSSNAVAVRAAAAAIGRLEPGDLAALRRMQEDRPAPAFWRLAARHPGTIGRADQEPQWVAVLRIIAILTPTGNPEERPVLHDQRQPLGKVLCDGGDPAWDGNKPALSEQRLAQLLAARGAQRAVLLTRAMRAIARSRAPDSGVNVVDIAAALVPLDDHFFRLRQRRLSERRIAKPYYDRLDAAQRTEPTGETAK